MKLLHSLEPDLDEVRLGAVTIGNFDGVHHGHARILEELRRQADRVEGPAVVFTFSPHPVQILRPQETPTPLSWPTRKAELLAELGVDAMIAYPTDRKLLQLSPESFFTAIIVEQLSAKVLVEGPNFFFGKNRSGDIDLLKQLCRSAHVTLRVVEPLKTNGEVVSSSRLRQLIQTGEVGAARKMLTQPYRLPGCPPRRYHRVSHGEHHGAHYAMPGPRCLRGPSLPRSRALGYRNPHRPQPDIQRKRTKSRMPSAGILRFAVW